MNEISSHASKAANVTDKTQETIKKDELAYARQACSERVAQQAADIPEIATKQEELARAGAEIIDTFLVQPSLFEDAGRSLIFTSIANLWHQTGGAGSERTTQEEAFVANVISLLAYNHSPKLATLKQSIEARSETNLDPEEELRVYEKYTDEELSAQMRQKIEHGLLDDVKARLGITKDNEDSYGLRVITIDREGVDSEAFGVSSLAWEDIPGDDATKKRVMDEQEEARLALQAQKQELTERSKAMAAELGLASGDMGQAWKTRLGEGERLTLCISKPFAQKLLYPEMTRHSTWYNETYRARDFALLEHEYTHGQGEEMNLDHNFWFAIGIDELRAEFFSGNKTEYHDIKGLFSDVLTVSGFSAADCFKDKEKGGTRLEIYSAIANKLGLQAMLELTLVPPRMYLDEYGNQYQEEIVEYLDGYDGIVSRLMDRAIKAGQKDEIEKRVTLRAQDVARAFPVGPGNTWVKNRQKLGLKIVTKLVADRIATLEPVA